MGTSSSSTSGSGPKTSRSTTRSNRIRCRGPRSTSLATRYGERGNMSTATSGAEFQTSKDLPLLRRTTTVAGKGGQVVIRHLNEEVVLEDEAAHLFTKLRPELGGATAIAKIAAKVSEKPSRVRALLKQLEKAGVVAFQSGMDERALMSGMEFYRLHRRLCNGWLEDVYLHPLWEKITTGKATRAQV